MATAIHTPAICIPNLGLKLMLITDAVIERRLFGIYKLLSYKKIDKVIALVNETIWNLQNAEEYESNMSTVNTTINVLYTILIDIARKRYNMAHDKVRDLRFTMW
jgi:hypothetical protein